MFAALALCTAPKAFAADAPADPRMAEHALGNPKAPVRIDEYYSLDCPHCAAFVVETLPQLTSDFIDKGKVYLVLHDFPLHEMALRATMLARCAPPERFFPMVDTLFHVQRGWLLQTEGASMDALKQQAKFAGLTDSQIDSCLNDRGLEDAILAERLDAEKSVQIEATPTFIFNQNNSDRIVSAAPFDTFKDKINSLLK
jgi:protein-disulfide isomerase